MQIRTFICILKNDLNVINGEALAYTFHSFPNLAFSIPEVAEEDGRGKRERTPFGVKR